MTAPSSKSPAAAVKLGPIHKMSAERAADFPLDALPTMEEKQQNGVPTNAELAGRAKSLDAHTVVRNWLGRHPMPQTQVTDDRNRWLDWAASNFLADPEIAVHLAARSSDAEKLRARIESITAGLGRLAAVLDSDDEDQASDADLLRSVQSDLRAALDAR